jgi:membrane associated rhomboid family serine protease
MPGVSRASAISASFGPGPPTPAVKLLLIITVGAYAAQLAIGVATYQALEPLTPLVVDWLGLTPLLVMKGFVWQPVTYLFLHATVMHVLFNMLALWMFGVDLERRWGKTAFFRYYFVCGVGAGLTCIAAAFLPRGIVGNMYGVPTIGASGAVYGLLLAYAMLFPTRTVYLLIFPVNVRIYVIIAGVLVLLQSFGGGGNGVAHFAHLGGLIFGYLYLSIGRGGPWAEIKYRYVKWRMNRLRKRFDVHDGGRRWDSRVH